MSYLFAFLLFSFLVFIHELGHFLTAKAFGVQVNEFSLFMGPTLFKKQIGETLYSIRCIPIGGFCAMEGEDEESNNPRSFPNAVWWKRMVILAAGAAMNFLTGVVLLACFFAPDKQFIKPVITQIDPRCSFTGVDGIQEGDRILRVDGERIYVYSDFSLILSLNPGDVHDLVLERDGKTVTLNALKMEKQDFENEDGTVSKRYGFSFSVTKATLWEKVKYTWASAMDTVRMVRLSLRMLFTGQAGVEDVSGPVGIVSQMAQVADQSGSRYYGKRVGWITAFFGLLSCGSWVRAALEQNKLLKAVCVVGPPQKSIEEVIKSSKEEPWIDKVCFVSGEELEAHRQTVYDRFLEKNSIPVYLSFDKDILREEDASANWDQGEMSLEELLALIKCCFEKQTIAGVDICGENAKKEGNWEASEVEKNNKTNLILLETIGQWMKEQEVNR